LLSMTQIPVATYPLLGMTAYTTKQNQWPMDSCSRIIYTTNHPDVLSGSVLASAVKHVAESSYAMHMSKPADTQLLQLERIIRSALSALWIRYYAGEMKILRHDVRIHAQHERALE
jgi:hypothetical protein